MSTPRRVRPQSLQPELPLPAPASPVDHGPEMEWHLDEKTRVLGRQGIAAARALLERSDFPGHGPHLDDALPRASRAA